MRKAILGYIFQSIVISLILALSYFSFYTYGYPHFYTASIFYLIAIVYLVNVGFHSFLVVTAVKDNQAFVRRFLASTMLKLLVYLIILLTMILVGTPQMKIVLLSFLVLYIVFTVHEVYSIMDFLKKNGAHQIKSK
jgi:hypothetical protein